MISTFLKRRFKKNKHVPGSYIKNIVYGGLDGIITTFAVAAGASGASLSTSVLLILGSANLIGDGISMAVGDFMSSRAEKEYIQKNGLTAMNKSSYIGACYTFFSFIIFGFFPLLTYVISPYIDILNHHTFVSASIFTGITLFLLGVLKVKFTKKNLFFAGFEMVFVGGISAAAAYFVGYIVSLLV